MGLLIYACVKTAVYVKAKRNRGKIVVPAPHPDGYAPNDKVLVTGGKESGRIAWVAEAGVQLYKGTEYVSLVFFDHEYDEHRLIEKEYCWNVTRKGGYGTNGTNEGKLS